jgi:hypothetical protein
MTVEAGAARRSFGAVEIVAIAGLGLAAVARFMARPHAPLWLDETFTGALITQPDPAHFVRAMQWDVQAPLYGLLMWVWQAVFGVSDAALRAPSVIFGLATPMVILAWPLRELGRAERLAWAALTALWIPGIGFAQDARCYSLVVLLATIQSLLFRDLLRETSLGKVALWVIACEATIAGHYDAGYLAFAQGLIFLGVKRGAAVRCWPAGLLLAPLAAFAAWQYPQAALYMQPGVVWYGRAGLNDLPAMAGYLIGWNAAALGVIAAVLASPALARGEPAPASDVRALAWAAASAALGFALIALAGMIRPTLVLRYLAPFAPGVMLGLVLAVRALTGRRAGRPLIFLQGFAIVICLVWLARGAPHRDSVLEPESWERASLDLIGTGTRAVYFLWDSPDARIMPRDYAADAEAFFLRRAKAPIEVIPVMIGEGQDPNQALLKSAAPADSAIVWVYDKMMDGVAARRFSPRIATLDPTWSCRNYAEGNPAIGVISCRRRPGAR